LPVYQVRELGCTCTKGAWELAETKTRRGRTVTLPRPVVRALTRHRARQSEARLLLGGEYASYGLLFAGTFGQPLFWANVVRRHLHPTLARTARRLQGRRVLEIPRTGQRRTTRASWHTKWERLDQQALEATGLAKMRPYDLRHSAATLLLAAGEHPKVVAELLGHSKITLTLDTYSHVVPALLEQAARRMEDIVSGRDIDRVRTAGQG
jgi:integrase